MTAEVPAPSERALDLHIERLAINDRVLIHGLHLHVPPGCIHTVMGPSGCGKSSLLAAVGGTLPQAFDLTALVRIGNFAIDSIPTHRRGVGMLFQDDLLLPHLTVLENLLIAVPLGARTERRALAMQALHEVELGGYANRDPATLSGGQRARVALQRALLAKPRALLLDEPFSKLDADLRAKMRELVFGAVRKQGIPALLVTHDEGDVADAGRVTRLA